MLVSNRHFQIFGHSKCVVKGMVVVLGEGNKDLPARGQRVDGPGSTTMSCLQKLPNARAKRAEICGLERQAMRKTIWSAFFVLSLSMGLAISAMAQSDTARLQGTVTDAQGGAIAGATVTVTSADTSRRNPTDLARSLLW